MFYFEMWPDVSLDFNYSLSFQLLMNCVAVKTITICQILYIYKTCDLEHSSKTFGLPSLSVT